MGFFTGKFVYLLKMGGVTLYACLIKDKLIDLLKEPLIEKALLTLHVITKTRFFTSEKPKHIMHDLVKKYVMGWSFFWTTF